MLSDLEIAQSTKLEPVKSIAAKLGLKEDDLEEYGKYKAKIDVDSIKKDKQGKIILVTAISPTKAGEGKSTTTVGLADALNRLKKNVIVALREPSLGPVLGMKGGACGGGYAQVVPMEDINLHFTGDLHAITCANNAIAAIIDNHIYQGNELRIDPTRITWHRCLDMNDRALRNITCGLGGSANGVPREDHFDITVASEIMAILCLATSPEDFKERIARTVVAYNYDKEPVTVDQLKATGVVCALMKDALKPNLVQTLEHTPALVHGGPFANIAHGCNSYFATKAATKLANYVVTEAGFGADLGAEKFFDIKCRETGIKPSCVVLVATIRALKLHGGVLYKNLKEENLEALKLGIKNLEKHIENVKKYNLPYVVAVNRFFTDTDAEVEYVLNWAKENGHEVSLSEVFAKGGLGGIDLAEKVIKAIDNSEGEFKLLYEDSQTLKEKIETVCKEIYGAKNVEFLPAATSAMKQFSKLGWDNLAICMAKTQYSLSDNPKLLGRPENFTITIRDLIPAIGAGFIVALTGEIMRMPGLPAEPAANNIDVVDGKIVGLF